MTTFVDSWFSSDIHFHHKNIQKFCPETRSKGSLEEMNELIIQRHNARVKPGDFWYHLGDFSFGTYEQTREILKRMNGVKRFFRGNHDRQLDKVLENDPELVQFYSNYKKMKVNDRTIVFCHFPIESWDQKFHGSLHIHGHLHGDTHHECTTLKNRFDVGIDNRREGDMAPFHFDEVIERIEIQNVGIERAAAAREKMDRLMAEHRAKGK